jgi:hypothetical protein
MTTTNGAAMQRDAVIERVIVLGDLSELSPRERSAYYLSVCDSVGLNPSTMPFLYVRLNGKLALYATKNCSDQLRQIHGVSVVSLSRETVDGIHIVTATVVSGTGRRDEDVGAVNIAGKKGEDLANALMKATTKAKRRATLSLCGLSFLDETELDTVKGAKLVTVTDDGEIVDEKPIQPAKPAPTSEPDLTRQLQASVDHDGDWKLWAGGHLTSLRRAAEQSAGALLEEWLTVKDDIGKMKPPREWIDVLNAAKNELLTTVRGDK